MNKAALAKAIRDVADPLASDLSNALRVLADVVEGRPTVLFMGNAGKLREFLVYGLRARVRGDSSDGAELMRVLARIVEGKPVEKAFGAPGDWGYGTRIGDALAGRN